MALAPFKELAHLAEQCREAARELPAKIDAAPRWSGLGFQLMGERYIAPMGQISELLVVPSHTRLPGVQPWVLGLSNVRGRLLPLFDLSVFLGGQLGSQRRNHRVLVFESDDLFTGLVIERSLGMQHFELGQHTRDQSADIPSAMLPYLDGAYIDTHAKLWNVVDFNRMADDPGFVNASLL